MNKANLIEALEKAGYARHERQLEIPAAAAQTITRKEERIAELEAVLGDLLDEGKKEPFSFKHFGKWKGLAGTEKYKAARKSLGENNE